jgi:uncharacterized repeat protein (TIGR01451 family)
MLRSFFRALTAVWLSLSFVVLIGSALTQVERAQAAPPAMPLTIWTVPGACGVTIQACINNASVAPGDTLLISAGIYAESLTLSKPISLTGALSSTTIIRALPSNRVLLINSTVTGSIVISGLTFVDGNVNGPGGGIANVATAPVLMQNVIVSNNLATSVGGGLYSSIEMTLTNVAFYANGASGNGGGANVVTATVIGGTFERNRCTGFCTGGGIYGNNTLYLNNTTVLSNISAYNGGGAGAGSLSIVGGLFQSNISNGPAGGSFGGGGATSFSTTSISGTQFISNSAVVYGGGLWSYFTTTLTNAVFISNNTTSITGTGGGAMEWYPYLTLVSGGQFIGNVSGSAGGLYGGGPTFMNGTRVMSNTAQNGYGGGVHINNAVAVLNSVAFTNNQIITNGYGGGLSVFGTLTGTNLLFVGNGTATHGGGGAYANNAVLTNPQFINNRAGGNWGGGLYAGAVILSGGYFTGNVAPQYTGCCGGGGMIVFGDSSLSGTQFYSNSTGGWGGGAYLYTPSSVAPLNNVKFISNTAGRDGGGLFSWYTTTLTTPLFVSNTSGYAGGGAYLGWFAGTAQVVGGQFISNTSGTGGGGLYSYGFLTLTGTQFLSNTANANNGGGAWTTNSASATNVTFMYNTLRCCNNSGALDAAVSLTLTNGYFFRNTNLSNNGGAAGVGLNAMVLNSQFISNTTAQSGGGLMVYGNAVVTNTQFISNYSAAGSGGGLLANGYVQISNTQFLSNSAGVYGGGVTGFGAYVNVVSSIFRNNRSINLGGGITTFTATLTNSRLELNRTTGSNGGAVYAQNFASFSNTLVLSNTAAGYGGGIQGGGPTVVNGGLFQNNSSGLNGGGMSVANTIDITGTQFISNATVGSSGAGGGAAAASYTVTVNGGYFALNRASSQRGGALWTGLGMQLNNSTFLTNTAASGDGGAVAALGATSISGGLFRGNTSGAHGGAVYAGSDLSLDSAQLIANTGDSGGGAYLETGNGYIVNALFARNTAVTTLGAAVHSVTTGTVRLVHDTLANPALVNNRAVYVVSSTLGITDSIVANFVQGIEGFGASVYEDYNLFYGNTSNIFGGVTSGGYSSAGDPAFANAAGDDYHLTSNSLAIDEAYDIGVSSDFEGQLRPQGSAPDIGFDESPDAAAADLVVSQSAVRTSAAPGQPVTFTIAIANFGPQIAHDIIFTDSVPAEIAGVSIAGSLPITPVTTNSWLLGSLPPGSSAIVTITGVFSPSLAGATLFTNTVTAASTTADLNSSNNTSSAAVALLQLAFASPAVNVNEDVGSGVANITINLIPASSVTVTVAYSATAGTATAGSDFLAVNGTLTFAPGQTAQSFPVPIVDDALPEANETVNLVLFNPSGAVFLTPGSALMTIMDDDLAAQVYLPLIIR